MTRPPACEGPTQLVEPLPPGGRGGSRPARVPWVRRRQVQLWTQDLPAYYIEHGVVCQAFVGADGNDEIGKLAISDHDMILVVEVLPEYRRKGIATRLFNELRNAGYRVEHDWNNITDDAEAWAQSVGAAPPE
jgi:GNAT superfamily N-acetyltransferase